MPNESVGRLAMGAGPLPEFGHQIKKFVVIKGEEMGEFELHDVKFNRRGKADSALEDDVRSYLSQ